MTVLRSLRHRVIAGMVLLIALVFGIALLGVNSIRALDHSVESGAVPAAREHGPRERPGLLGGLRDPLGGAVPRPAHRAAPCLDDRRGRLGLRLPAPLPGPRVPDHRRPLHREQDRVESGADRGGVRYGACAHRSRPSRRRATHGGSRPRAGRHAARRRARARSCADHPLDRPGRRPPPPGGQPPERALGPVLRLVAAGLAHLVLDGALGGPPDGPSHRRGGAVRRRRPPAHPSGRGHAHRDRAPGARDGRHGRTSARGGASRWWAKRARSATARAISPR